jgi:hypothetical protein
MVTRNRLLNSACCVDAVAVVAMAKGLLHYVGGGVATMVVYDEPELGSILPQCHHRHRIHRHNPRDSHRLHCQTSWARRYTTWRLSSWCATRTWRNGSKTQTPRHRSYHDAAAATPLSLLWGGVAPWVTLQKRCGSYEQARAFQSEGWSNLSPRCTFSQR